MSARTPREPSPLSSASLPAFPTSSATMSTPREGADVVDARARAGRRREMMPMTSMPMRARGTTTDARGAA